jgi:hypothetical protein
VAIGGSESHRIFSENAFYENIRFRGGEPITACMPSYGRRKAEVTNNSSINAD